LALDLFAYSIPCSAQQQIQALPQQSPNES
jgi:hypothetical protein